MSRGNVVVCFVCPFTIDLFDSLFRNEGSIQQLGVACTRGPWSLVDRLYVGNQDKMNTMHKSSFLFGSQRIFTALLVDLTGKQTDQAHNKHQGVHGHPAIQTTFDCCFDLPDLIFQFLD